jgi:hypothetical protein
MLEGGEQRMSTTEREQEILARYAHWKAIITGHGLNAPETVEEFLEVASCDGQGGCVADTCSGGNGSGCMADSCSAGGGGSESNHKQYIQTLASERHANLAGKKT